MLASIDSPQGDQVARTPATAATVRPTTRTALSGVGIGLRRTGEAGVAGTDAGGEQLAVDAAGVVPRVALGVGAGGAAGRPVGAGLPEEGADGRPVRAGALTDDATGAPFDMHEVRRPGDVVV